MLFVSCCEAVCIRIDVAHVVLVCNRKDAVQVVIASSTHVWSRCLESATLTSMCAFSHAQAQDDACMCVSDVSLQSKNIATVLPA